MNVCRICGTAANTLTCLIKYGEPPKKILYDVSTIHLGECEVCSRKTNVTEERDFFYPNFTLLSRKFIKAVKENDPQD